MVDPTSRNYVTDGPFFRKGKNGNLYLVLHSTNVNPNERPRLFRIAETEDCFEIIEQVNT